MKTQFTGTWFISEMESWDADYINLVDPGYLTVDPEGSGSMQFGALNVDLDWRVADIKSGKKLQFTFEGFDEGDPVSGRGWATISGPEMTGRIYFHDGDESGFKASREKKPKTSVAPHSECDSFSNANLPGGPWLGGQDLLCRNPLQAARTATWTICRRFEHCSRNRL